MRPSHPLVAATAALAVLTGCLEPAGPPGAAITQDADTGQVFITDRTGKTWEVTHAVAKYGFVAGDFQFGIGPDAIPPVFEPSLAGPGDPGYPAPDAPATVVGVALGGDPRAYPLAALNRHEIVNEHFPNAPVAVAY